MTYITGTVTDANPGPALHAVLAPALTAAGFTLVDTVVISTRTHKVWKSPAAGNAQNLDWFLDVAYTTTGAGNVSFCAFEFFDPATDLGYRGPFNTTGTTIDATTSSRYGAVGHALETNWAGAQTTGMQNSITTIAFGYWISVTTDRVIYLSSTVPDRLVYAGFYLPDPLYAAKAGAALYPLFSGRAGGVAWSDASVALTRVPPWTSVGVGWHATITALSVLPGLHERVYPALPTGVTTSYPFTAFPIQLTPYNAASSPYFIAGRWGWLRDSYQVPSIGVARGDTCTIGGAAYVLGTTASNSSWAFRTA